MTHRYLVDEPADLAAIFADHAAQCRATADAVSTKAVAAQWTIRAEAYEACADIARRAVLTIHAQRLPAPSPDVRIDGDDGDTRWSDFTRPVAGMGEDNADG